MCGCKIGRSMARKGKGTKLSTEDVAWAFGGAVSSLFVNRGVNMATKSMDAGTREMIGKGLPMAKMLGGGYVALNRKTPRNWKFFAIGVGGTAAVEAGIKFMPQYFAIGAADGSNVFDVIGSSNLVELPIAPNTDLQLGELYEDELLGTEVQYHGVPML